MVMFKLNFQIQNLNHTNSDYKMCQPAMQDSNGILSGIQSLIAENEKLKAKIEEQKGKLDQQNDRIFHLLELNQK